jgi:predicted anti-sigma-YlaC factor YlaD
MPDHSSVRRIIDQSLAGAAPSAQERQTLREHLAACAACQQYLDASSRAIAALADFSFPMDPALDSKVVAAIAARARQLESERRRLWWPCCLALLLTIAGSIAVSQLGSLAAVTFHLEPAQLHLGLATFWIAPSVLICMLLLLPGFQAVLGSRKGLSL